MLSDNVLELVLIGGGVQIFEHNFVDGKANFRRRAVARQENSTQSSGKICRKDARLSYENMFLFSQLI